MIKSVFEDRELLKLILGLKTNAYATFIGEQLRDYSDINW